MLPSSDLFTVDSLPLPAAVETVVEYYNTDLEIKDSYQPAASGLYYKNFFFVCKWWMYYKFLALAFTKLHVQVTPQFVASLTDNCKSRHLRL